MWDWRIQLELQAILKECWTQLPRGKFKKSHLFLLRIWEALFRTFLVNFSTETPTGNKIATQIMDVLKQAEQLTTPDASALLKLIKHTCDDEGKLKKEFMQYMHQLSAVDETCKFWMKFILEDCLPYIGLFVSIRSGELQLEPTVGQPQTNGCTFHCIWPYDIPEIDTTSHCRTTESPTRSLIMPTKRRVCSELVRYVYLHYCIHNNLIQTITYLIAG